MRLLLVICGLLYSCICLGNMASPVREGSLNANALTSRDIHVLAERIDIVLNKDSASALFDVVYTIHTTVAGKQVPLLFIARDYKDGFKVWTDGKPASVQQVTDSFRTGISSLNGFDSGYAVNELLYFEVNLDTGIHNVHVRYSALPETDHPTWRNKCTISYLLEPAAHWKSFGQLDIVLHKEGFPYTITTDLPVAATTTDSTIAWHFNGLPQNSFNISYQAEPQGGVAQLIDIGSFPFAVAISVLLLLLNLWLVARYRRRSRSRFNPFVIAGALLVPFLFCSGFVLFDEIVNILLPPLLQSPDGYVFLVFIFYPFIMPVYWCVIWLADRYFKKRTAARDLAVSA